MYIIVVGAGAIGSQVLDLLKKTRNELVVIENDATNAEQISREYDCLVLNADATVKETLIDAGADQADAVITTTDEDATNIMVMLLAQELDISSKVSVVQNPEHIAIFGVSASISSKIHNGSSGSISSEPCSVPLLKTSCRSLARQRCSKSRSQSQLHSPKQR